MYVYIYIYIHIYIHIYIYIEDYIDDMSLEGSVGQQRDKWHDIRGKWL